MSGHPPIPDDVAALISAHALGALEPDQADLAEQHIAASDECRRAYEDALETAAALALAVADSEPPADLRERILTAARAERAPAAAPVATSAAPRRRLGLAGLLTPSAGFAVVGVAAAIVFALVAVSQHNSASSARDRQAALVSILSAPDARVVPLASTAGGSAGGRVIVSRGRAALVSSLKSPPPGHTYQAWGLRPGGAAPVPLPTFSRNGVLILNDVGTYDGVGVTVEPSGGSQRPSAAPFVVASL
ncbi:MAG TPA: anti-sigma factor [Gaiellales bacterium]|jgi:anti-sigma-K factor RskA|nr:anti-sigma factor [Gaiellales bacterium]